MDQRERYTFVVMATDQHTKGSGLLIAVMLVCLGVASRASAQRSIHLTGTFQVLTEFSPFQVSTSHPPSIVTWTSPTLRSATPGNELALSWNAKTPGSSGFEFEARAKNAKGWTPYYSLGRWAERTNTFLRQSVAKQKDVDGEVLTDLLRLSHSTREFQLRIRLTPDSAGSLPTLRSLGISIIDTSRHAESRPPNLSVWGNSLNVPQISQHAYVSGKAWCSPTSLSMVLGYWAERLHAPEIKRDVAEVAQGVFDPVWGGTGNWPFNTAYAGTFDSLEAHVVRLRDLRDVEDLIGNKTPVILSVDLNALHEKKRNQVDGHLVVAVGFTETGDVWINDPDTTYPPVPGKAVRRIYPREAVDRAWAASHRTIYLIQPVDQPAPRLR